MTNTTYSFDCLGLPEVHDPRLVEILDEYLAQIEAGQAPDADALIARCPELGDELRAYFDSIEFLQKGVVEDDTPAFELCAGRSLGDYRIVGEVGRGGMGIIYEATQISLDRRVALKVLPFSAMLDRRQITRFSIEAQAAAQLHHPHIVPVHSVGCERGIHFYSMQFIDGRSLDVAIEELRAFASKAAPGKPDYVSNSSAETRSGFSTSRTTESRGYVRAVARLGIDAAEALQHAHDCGVVHRDVKPSNLLLDREGKLWVADFGLARFPADAGITLTGAVLGTVRYMSPEQAAGESHLVDQRSDIYSLGATVYELLTLSSVFNAENREQFLRQIEQIEPESPRRINPAIPVDLETIILKALAKKRRERYATAQAMADDLRRFLDGTPIAARRPSLVDRAGKWAARHQSVLRASLAVLLLMLIGAWLCVLLIAREQRHTQAALVLYEDNFAELRDELGNFGVLIADELAELPGAEPLRDQILNRTLAVYDRLIDQAKDNPSLQADLAVASFKAAELRERIGQTAEALAAYQRAAAVFGRLHSREPANHKLQRDLAACHNNIALLRSRDGETSASRRAFEEAIRLQETLVAATADPHDELALASMLHNFGALMGQVGEADQAESSHAAALVIQERLSRQAPDNDHLRRELALSYNNMAYRQRDDNLAEAIDYNQLALAMLRAGVSSPNSDTSSFAELALCLNNRGALLSRSGELQQACEAYREAVEVYERLARHAPSVVEHRRDLAVSKNNLGRTLSQSQHNAEAERAFLAARQTLAALVDEVPGALSYRSSLGGVLNNLAMLLEREGRIDEATSAYEQAIECQRSSLERAPAMRTLRAHLTQTCNNYTRMLRDAGNSAQAAAVEQDKRRWLAAAVAAQQQR